MAEQSIPQWLLDSSVTARYLALHSIQFQVVWNTNGKGVVSCSDVSRERHVEESRVAKTVVAVTRGEDTSPPGWIVAVVRGNDLIDWGELKKLMDIKKKRDLTPVPPADLQDFGIPVGAIAPPQLLDLPIPVRFAVDGRLHSPDVERGDLIDFSSGLRLVGLQLPGSSVAKLFHGLNARFGEFSRKSVIDFPIPLGELTDQKKLDVVELLALLALEDGERCEKENNLLSAVAERLAVSQDRLSKILIETDNYEPDTRKTQAPVLLNNLKDLDGRQRNWIVFTMALLAYADEGCDNNEEERIKGWAAELNVSLDDTRNILSLGDSVRNNNAELALRLNSRISEQFAEVIKSVTES